MPDPCPALCDATRRVKKACGVILPPACGYLCFSRIISQKPRPGQASAKGISRGIPKESIACLAHILCSPSAQAQPMPSAVHKRVHITVIRMHFFGGGA